MMSRLEQGGLEQGGQHLGKVIGEGSVAQSSGFLVDKSPLVTLLESLSNSLGECPLLECSGLCAQRAEVEGSHSLDLLGWRRGKPCIPGRRGFRCRSGGRREVWYCHPIGLGPPKALLVEGILFLRQALCEVLSTHGNFKDRDRTWEVGHVERDLSTQTATVVHTSDAGC